MGLDGVPRPLSATLCQTVRVQRSGDAWRTSQPSLGLVGDWNAPVTSGVRLLGCLPVLWLAKRPGVRMRAGRFAFANLSGQGQSGPHRFCAPAKPQPTPACRISICLSSILPSRAGPSRAAARRSGGGPAPSRFWQKASMNRAAAFVPMQFAVCRRHHAHRELVARGHLVRKHLLHCVVCADNLRGVRRKWTVC